MKSLSNELHQAYIEFENSLSVIGWTFKKFCFYYYENVINDSYDDEIESNRFYEKQKKKKQRKTHSLNELSDFIRYIINHSDLETKGLIKPQCLSDDELSPEFEEEMKKISKEITKMIKN